MVSTLIVLAAAATGLGLTWSLLRGRPRQLITEADWEQKRHDVDINVFRMLLDQDEESFMRRSLSRDQFDSFQRRRVRLALHMLHLAEDNARMLIGMAQLARMRSDAELTHRAQDLISAAIQFRINLISARIFLYLKWLLPHWNVSIPPFDLRYQRLLDSLTLYQQAAYQL
jgi:hypothetical protein